MKILIAEDDYASRKFLSKFLSKYADCDAVEDGAEAIEAFEKAYMNGEPYDLVCLDIMMPRIDGIKVLKAIRSFESNNNINSENKVKVIMTTSLLETPFVNSSFEMGCDAYAMKPIDLERFIEVMQKTGFNISIT